MGTIDPHVVAFVPHDVHTEARVDDEVPATHEEQFTARPSLYVPPSHDEHVVALDATLVWSPAPVSWDEREEGGYVG